MYISTTTEPFSFSHYGDDKKIVKLIKDSGFTAYDYSMCCANGLELLEADDYIERAKALRAYADEIGLPCNQTHAPFATAKKGNEEWNKAMYPKILRALEISGILGAQVCVVHPCNHYTAEENAVLYQSFAATAKKAGVKIGVENMWNWAGRVVPAACSHQDDFLAHMQLLDKEAFVACVDIGHAEMMHEFDTDAPKIIEKLGGYMQSMHLHDVDFSHDNHAFPFNCNIDYNAVINALKKINYQGDITMEALYPLRKLPVELIPAATRYLAEIGKWFLEQVQEK